MLGPAVLRFDGAACEVAGGVRLGALDLDVHPGEVVVLAGARGAGKTALLGLVNRTVGVGAGVVTLDGQDVRRLDLVQLRRTIGYAAAVPALLAHRPLAESIALVPRVLGWDHRRVAAAVDRAAAVVGLPPVALARRPRDLAPGDAQLGALARALAADPLVVVLDEPFAGAPDAQKVPLAARLRAIAADGRAVLFATRDPEQMIAAAGRVVLVDEGRPGPPTDPLVLLRGPLDRPLRRFLSPDPGLTRLRLLRVGDVPAQPGPFVPPHADAHRAAQLARALGTDWVLVTDEDARPRGWALVSELPYGRRISDDMLRPVVAARPGDTLLAALDTLAAAGESFAVQVDTNGRAAGILRADVLVAGAW